MEDQMTGDLGGGSNRHQIKNDADLSRVEWLGMMTFISGQLGYNKEVSHYNTEFLQSSVQSHQNMVSFLLK